MGVFLNHYKDLLGTRQQQKEIDMSVLYEPNSNLHNLDSPFSEEEVLHAVNQLQPNKASGPDGLPNEFLKQFFDQLKPHVLNVIDDFMRERANLATINKARIVLVPKTETPQIVTDYRPISVINLIPKLISELLANRLKTHMADLISENQTAFIQDRFIAKNFLATREALHHVHQAKCPAILLKLDFRKAFDTLDWAFLRNVMSTRGFPQKFVRWVFHLLTTSSSSIVLNGYLSSYFDHNRGLRQGDPLSPYLFILAADVLQRMTSSIPSSPPFNLTAKLTSPILTFQYADDTIFLLSARGSTIRTLLLVLHCFSNSSGLLVNLSKSAFVPLSISEDHTRRIEALIGCPRKNLPLTYLGMPLTLKAPAREDFMPLLEKMEQRLEGWRARFISRAGKLQLIKSVLSAIPTYYMSCFRFPTWLIDRIDSIRRQFLWSRPQPAKGIHLLNWRRVCLPIGCGGLGVTNLQLQNMALLLRWWWRLFTHDNKLWKTYATKIYALPTPQWAPLILSTKGSFFWNSIRTLRPLFHSCSQFQIDSGKNISFWFDGWDGQPLHLEHSGPLRHAKISLYHARDPAYNLLAAPLTLRQQAAMEKMSTYVPGRGKDRLIWTISSSGLFTAQSAYRILSQGGKIMTSTTSLWKIKATPSMRVFFYLLLNNRLLTHDNLQRRNLPHSQGCIMCSDGLPESIMHLFFRCSFARQIWSKVSTHFGISIITTQDSILQTYASSMPANRQIRKIWGTVFLTLTWNLWKERNHRTFRHTNTTLQVLTDRILQESRLCYAYC